MICTNLVLWTEADNTFVSMVLAVKTIFSLLPWLEILVACSASPPSLNFPQGSNWCSDTKHGHRKKKKKKIFFKGPQWIKEHNVICLRMTAKTVFTLESILVHCPQVYLVKVASSWVWDFPPGTILWGTVSSHKEWILLLWGSTLSSAPWIQIHLNLGYVTQASHSNSLSICFIVYQMDMTMPPFQNTVCLQWVHMCRAFGQDNLKHTIKTAHSLFSPLPALVKGAPDPGEEDESCCLAPRNWQRFLYSGFRKPLAVRVVWLVTVDVEGVSVGNSRQIKKLEDRF